MTSLPGQTRTRVRARHALITPDGHVASVLSGITGARVVAHITPAMGAGFVQLTIDFEAQGEAAIPADQSEYFFYIQTGSIEAVLQGQTHLLTTGSYLYLPPYLGAKLHPLASTARVIVFQKKFVPLADTAAPSPVVSHASKVAGQPFLGNPQALLQVLLPDGLSFDLAVNIFTYQPGATLPFVETHVMEHGLLMLSGEGNYQLEEDLYSVAAGDVIWMAPYCPQWFVATGNTPASYLYYKDVNRPLLT
jgi:(S)-ureidoglycine aminohydrolase